MTTTTNEEGQGDYMANKRHEGEVPDEPARRCWGRAEGIYFILISFLLTTIEKVDGGRLVARSRADTPPTHGTTERDRLTAIAVTRGPKPNAGPERVRWGRAKKGGFIILLPLYITD